LQAAAALDDGALLALDQPELDRLARRLRPPASGHARRPVAVGIEFVNLDLQTSV
jgi:hypothetical protein